MARKFREVVGGWLSAAARALPIIPTPKVKPKQKTIPGAFRSAKPAESALPKTDRRVASTDPVSFRNGTNTQQVIRDFAQTNPDLSASVSAFLRTGIPDTYTLVAYNMDGTFSREGTQLLQQLSARIDLVHNYDDGFSITPTLQSCSEALAKEGMLYGAMALELVLDDSALPARFAPVAVTTLEFYPDKSSGFKGVRPVQKVGSDEIDLDIPTFFYTALDPLLTDFTPNSPLESAIQPAIFSSQFMSDIRKVVRRVIHPRMNVTVKEDVLRRMAPPEALYDQDELAKFQQRIVEEVAETINSLEPEEALVMLDYIEVDYLNNGNISLNSEYEVLQGMANSKMATGAKTLPSILGHGSGSQNVASAEALVFMKNANGMVRKKLNELYSRAFTLAVRLFGLDCYAVFEYASIDLRPDSELEAFKATKQNRVLKLLSLGFVSDDEAAIALTGHLTPEGFTPLSGTRFDGGETPEPANPYSGTSVGGGQSGGGAVNQNIKPTTSAKPPGNPKAA